MYIWTTIDSIQKNIDPENNSIACDLYKNNFLAYSNATFKDYHAMMKNLHGYEYYKIQGQPGFTYA